MQTSLDFTSRVRSADPQTSVTAAINASRFANSHAGRILAALKTHGPRSAHELSQLIGLSIVQIDRRLPELAKQGLAKVVKLDDGADKVVAGCRVWRAA
jgi:predicted transcriptional regulator